MNMHASIKGGPELAAKLRQLSDEMAGKALEDATTAGALLVQNAAVKKAPFLTGTLRRSIHTLTTLRSRTRAVVAVGPSKIPYAAIQEFGGFIHAKGEGWLRFKTRDGSWHTVKSVQIPAHPYLRPALDENKGAVVREIGDSLRALLARFR